MADEHAETGAGKKLIAAVSVLILLSAAACGRGRTSQQPQTTGQNSAAVQTEAGSSAEPALDSAATQEAKLREAAAEKLRQQMNRLTKAVVIYYFGDRTERVDRKVIQNWLEIDDNGNVALKRSAVAAYVNELGRRYDTFGGTREFTTFDGRKKTITGGDYGWVIDQEAETEALCGAILRGENRVREPEYLYTAWSRTRNDIGDTYVEIDLTNQRMVFFKDGEMLVDTPVVTGDPSQQRSATPTGCFAVDAMESPSVLKGEDYESDVTFWMPFAGEVGIHDASWRYEFGGDIYLYNGSHGCVNTPYEQAEIIYRNIGVGAPVVVYE